MVYTEVKNQKQAKSKNRVMAKVCVSPAKYSHTEQSTNLNENISEATVFIKDVQNTVTSCHNFQEYSE